VPEAPLSPATSPVFFCSALRCVRRKIKPEKHSIRGGILYALLKYVS